MEVIIIVNVGNLILSRFHEFTEVREKRGAKESHSTRFITLDNSTSSNLLSDMHMQKCLVRHVNVVG